MRIFFRVRELLLGKTTPSLYANVVPKLSAFYRPFYSRTSGFKTIKTIERDPSVGCRFFFECKMGYEYHRRSHGTRVLSPRRKNPEEGESEEKRGRGRVRPPGRLTMSPGCLPRWWITGESWRAQSQGRSAASATTAVAGAAVTPRLLPPRHTTVTIPEENHPRVPV